MRNAAVQLWEKLTRPESVESRSSDDLRLNCAFADVFAKCYACLADEGDSAAARACVHLVANVLNGPPTIVALFDDHGLAWCARGVFPSLARVVSREVGGFFFEQEAVRIRAGSSRCWRCRLWTSLRRVTRR